MQANLIGPFYCIYRIDKWCSANHAVAACRGFCFLLLFYEFYVKTACPLVLPPALVLQFVQFNATHRLFAHHLRMMLTDAALYSMKFYFFLKNMSRSRTAIQRFTIRSYAYT